MHDNSETGSSVQNLLSDAWNAQVPDPIVVKAAAHKAVLASAKGALRSRSMHAELVFNLAGSKHVGHSAFAVAFSPGATLLL